jgi:hypothetical protein
MAMPAGIVNRDGPADRAAFESMIASSSEEVRTLAHAVRDLVFEVLPEAAEVVWPRQRSVGWGTGPRKFSEQFAYLMPFKRHVTLGFYRGGELPDPAGLLPREGGRQAAGSLSMRSLKLMTVDEIRRPALRSLLEAAARHGVTSTPGETDAQAPEED